ncbi:type II toxin-antitoxin system RelE/ParE family toxin [Stakelama tenebrarum]|uniref:Type II toxin-antitoxin system RelE/ParE family toxin n=1 Tax=Stakelama tenebrarum TaxID=2711215 RepID=A0A6G6Y183_9SPHN|nr:type II toxin-antitoxin system RelE/ParE family toxin [Sphingosinithalassobacter tenebrarum]QIG78682.1 type II toxin-antitoxin system RelE/ParE family toxin [Sphingosinithalassobacter tenebrarum]
MTRVHILPSADRDLGEIYHWIAQDDPLAAEAHVRRLVAAAQQLRDFPERGMARPEIGEGARSWAVGRYLLLYRTGKERVEIVRFLHGARDMGGAWDG